MEKVYRAEEIAEIMQVELTTVHYWLRTGRLGGMKFGKLWRITEDDLSTFLETARNKAIKVSENNKEDDKS